MARPALAHRMPSRTRPSMLSWLLLFTIIFETLVATWAFTHFGAGSSSIAVKRFPEWGAEGLVVIAACTAGCAWFLVQWKRWAAWGLLGGLALQVVWYLLRRPLPDGLPSGFFTTYLVITVGIALVLWFSLAGLWAKLDRE